VVHVSDTDPVAAAVTVSEHTWIDQPVWGKQLPHEASEAVITSTANPLAALPYLSTIWGSLPVLYTAPDALDPRTQSGPR
jgi:hypothetical protein